MRLFAPRSTASWRNPDMAVTESTADTHQTVQPAL